MADLTVDFLGFQLKNPIIVSSSTLTQNVEGIQEAEQAGAGAVVMRSLFEEAIREEMDQHGDETWSSHPEEYEYVIHELSMQYGANHYLEIIKEAKSKVNIPIIASINCQTPKWWVNYARQIEAAGADAIELNLSMMPIDPGLTPQDIEEEFISIVRTARETVQIPLSVKIGCQFTSLSRFANQICGAGASALVLFNRFYQLDIDINEMKVTGRNPYSHPDELHRSLRWVSVLYNRINCDLVGNTGIHDGAALIKFLLAGAQTVEIASTIYLNGFSRIQEMLRELEEWMNQKGYQKLSDFRGMLSLSKQKDPEMYERLQYIRALADLHD